MADPLSIAASVAGIVQLSGTVFKLINKFIREAKDAPSKVRDLAVQTRNLAGILENLKLLASSLDEETSKYALKAQHLNSCRHTLLTIERKLGKSQDDFDSGKLKALSRRLKWPFEIPETNELLTELSGHCSTLQLALSADSMGALLKCLAKQEEVKMMIERKLSIDMRVHLSERRKEVMEFFLRVNPQDNFQMSLDLRHPMTGLWLTESDPTFQRWKELPNAKLWLSGIPGGGKTVLCGAVIETILQESDESTAVCFAFCDYKDAKTHQPENILAAIAVQLGQQKEEAFDLLESYFDELNLGNQLRKQPRREPLLMLVKDMASMFEKAYIVVDGLDECGENISSMVKCLTSLVDSSRVISAALFSRKEDDIKDELEDNYDQIEIEAHTEDLKAYTLAQISRRKSLQKLEVTNASLHEEIFRTLVEGAQGMFRWVACQIDHISELPTNKARRKALKELPPTLFGTYDRVLEKVSKCPPETQVFVRKALHWISLGHHWIKIPQLCEAISIEEGQDSIDEDDFIDEAEISRRCGCLIRKSVDGHYFELSHFTVMEYLQMQSSIGEFQYSEIKAFRSLVETSLRFLVFPGFGRTLTAVTTMEHAQRLKRNETHPFYPFAAQIFNRIFLPPSLRKTWSLAFGEESVLSRCKHLFDLAKTGHFMAWCLESTIEYSKRRTLDLNPDNSIETFSQLLGVVLDSATTPLHMAVKMSMPELCRFLLQQGADVNSTSRFGDLLSLAIFSPRFPETNDAVEVLGILLDHGADTSVGVWPNRYFYHQPIRQKVRDSYNSATRLSALAHALNGRVKEFTLQLIRPSTQVLEDAINILSTWHERSQPGDGSLDDDILRAILELSTGADAPPHWQPMASPALILAKRKQTTIVKTMDADLYASLDEEQLLQAIEMAIKNGLVEDVSALLGNLRLHRDPARWESTVLGFLRLAAESKSAQGGKIMAVLLDSRIVPGVAVSEIQKCFYISCKSGPADTAQLMLDRGAKILEQEDMKGETVWHISAARGETDLLSVLLNGDPNVSRSLSTLSDAEMTPLCSAVAKGNIEASLLLLKHCSPDPCFFQSKPPLLHLAAKAGSRELFTALLATGVKLETESSDGSTPLHYLGASCSYDFAQYLTSLYDPFKLDRLFTSPFEKLLERRLGFFTKAYYSNNSALDLLIPPSLTYPAGDGNRETVHVWEIICNVIGRNKICSCEVDKEARPKPPCDSSCELSLGTSFRRGVLASYENARNQPAIIPLIEALIRRPEDQNLCSSTISFLFKNAVQGSAHTPSLKNVESGHELLQRFILNKNSRLTKEMLSYGLDVHRCLSAEDKDVPASPLETACSKSDLPTLELVLAAADPSRLNETNSSGHNLIDQVVSGSALPSAKITMAQALLDKGVKLNVENDSVSIAACKKDWDLVRFLLKIGGSLFTQGEDNWAAVHYVARDKNLMMLKSLLELSTVTPNWGVSCQATCDFGNRKRGDEHELSLLHLAARNRKDDMIEYFLDNGLLNDINITTKFGRTPLHYAAGDGQLSTCKLLVRRGAKLDSFTIDWELPLNFAIANNHMETAHFLLEAGSPLPAESTDEAMGGFKVDPTILGPFIKSGPLNKLMRHISLEKAILGGDLAGCKSAVAEGCSIFEPLPSCHSCTPLFAAIRACKEDVVEWLLEEGASLTSVSCDHNTHDDLPQHAAEFLSSARCLSRVLSAALYSWHSGSASPIYVAVERGNTAILKAVLTHIQENIEGYRNTLEPHLAGDARTVSDEGVMSLLINQVEISEDRFWDTALHRAARVEAKLAILKLLIKHGANVNSRNEYQETPLMIASRTNKLEIARELLASGAAVEPRDRDGVSAIANAVSYGHLQIVKLLDNQSSSALDYTFPDGGNLLSLVTTAGSSRAVFEYLISRGLDPGHCDRRGRCAFDTALRIPDLAAYLINSRLLSRMSPGPFNPFVVETRATHITPLKRLYKSLPRSTAQVFIDLETEGRSSPLCEAACRNEPRIVALLLDLHASIERESSPFGTPLMYAAVFGKLDVVKLLVRRGARMEYTNKNGVHRSAYVASAQYPEVISWLIRGRYQDQSKLNNFAFWGDTEVRCWSGKGVAQVKIKSSDQRRWKESTLDYCKRFWQIKKGFAGQRVVGVLV